MRTILMLLALMFVGLCAHPPMIPAAITAETQTPAIQKIYNDWVALRDLIRRLKMEISDLQAKIGATILTDGERASMNSLLGEDLDKLRDQRSAYREKTQILMAHWSDLTPEQRLAAQEAANYPE